MIFISYPTGAWSWGFFAHKQVNRYAITTLPPPMFRFYKANLVLLTEKSLNPDKRRYVVANEATKHFIDLEMYKDSLLAGELLSWQQAIERYGKGTVILHGELPWSILQTQQKLTKAFKEGDCTKILKYSADLGHYLADAHVPLHTTQNYDGQMTNQTGIHALWESHLPILFSSTYNFFVGQSSYIANPLAHIMRIIIASHALVPMLLTLEQKLSIQYGQKKYCFVQAGSSIKKQYTLAFATAYHQALEGQVEARFRASIIEVGNFWLTAWIHAGAPNLDNLTVPMSLSKGSYTDNSHTPANSSP